MTLFKVKIQTPGLIVIDSEFDQVLVDTSDGQITVLADHVSLITKIEVSIATLFKDGEKPVKLALNGGCMNIENNILTILTVDAEIIDNREKNTSLFAVALQIKNTAVQEEIKSAIQAGQYYEPEQSTVYLLAEERLAKLNLLKDLQSAS